MENSSLYKVGAEIVLQGVTKIEMVDSPMQERKHNHYFKSTPYDSVDVYRVLQLFNVTDPCLQHSVKKLLVAGGRGGGKDIRKDVQEAIDTLVRWQEMRAEEDAVQASTTVQR